VTGTWLSYQNAQAAGHLSGALALQLNLNGPADE